MRYRLISLCSLCVLCVSVVIGMHDTTTTETQRTQSLHRESDSAFSFTDVAGGAGLSRPTIYGDIDRKRYIIETNGSGVAFVDYDNDGWVDLFILSGTRLGIPAGKEPTNRLYRNKGNGTFVDVTDKAGL